MSVYEPGRTTCSAGYASCDEDDGGSHWHCGACGRASGMQGCGDFDEECLRIKRERQERVARIAVACADRPLPILSSPWDPAGKLRGWDAYAAWDGWMASCGLDLDEFDPEDPVHGTVLFSLFCDVLGWKR